MTDRKQNGGLSSKREVFLWVLGAGVVVITSFSLGYMFDFDLKPSQKFLTLIGVVKPTPTPLAEPDTIELDRAVLPEEGYTVNIKWGEVGKKLVAAGGIDMVKYRNNYKDEKQQEYFRYLTENVDEGITINEENAYFWVNTLWALGLTQKSEVLDSGIMGTQYKDEVGNFASTGGWTLGSKDAERLYSSANIIPLTREQHTLVHEISKNIYRPCCDNPTSFPDCNHGMAILALVELMVSQGFSEEEIYKAALAFNSYWFPMTYLDLAYYFQTVENTVWPDVDAKRVLGKEFSSATGYQRIKKEIGNIPGLQQTGGGCGA